MTNFNKLFPYVIIAFVVMAIIFAVTRPNDNTILTTIKDKNKAKIEDNKLIEDSLIKVIELLDIEHQKKQDSIKFIKDKIIYIKIKNDEKNKVIDTLGIDSITKYIRANF